MKLRIHGNSLRLRLGRSEVAALSSSGIVEDRIAFGTLPSEQLGYRLSTAEADIISAKFSDGIISVVLPTKLAGEWANSDQISLRASQSTGNGNELDILVEKDFVCIGRAESEDESDGFSHPDGKRSC